MSRLIKKKIHKKIPGFPKGSQGVTLRTGLPDSPKCILSKISAMAKVALIHLYWFALVKYHLKRMYSLFFDHSYTKIHLKKEAFHRSQVKY